MSVIIAEGRGSDLSSLNDYAGYFREGDTGEIKIQFANTLPREVLAEMEDEFLNQGIALTAPVTQRGGITSIKFKLVSHEGITGFWIPIIIAIVATTAFIGGGVVVWQILNTTHEIIKEIPSIVWYVGGAAIVYLIVRSAQKNKLFVKKAVSSG